MTLPAHTRIDPSDLHPSPLLIKVTKHFEGCRLRRYRDAAGVETIGWGHAREHGGPPLPASISQAVADELLSQDLVDASCCVSDHVNVNLTQYEFDALTDFVFNIGPGEKGIKDGFAVLKSGHPSTLLRLLNAGDYGAAADEFRKWDRAGGRVLSGLVHRRNVETRIFLYGDYHV